MMYIFLFFFVNNIKFVDNLNKKKNGVNFFVL